MRMSGLARGGRDKRLTRGGPPIRAYVVSLACLLAMHTGPAPAQDLADTVDGVRGSVVAVGTYQATRRPPAKVLGTGFAVMEGRHVATNAHVLPAVLDSERRERLAVFFRDGDRIQRREATAVALDDDHDLALLAIGGAPLPAMRLGMNEPVREGEDYAFTGFPIGAVLGLYPVTHRGMVSAISPVALPTDRSGDLDPELIKRLRDPFEIFQLDAIAYPGNSGSPLYETDTGRVVGIVNSVFVKESRERVLDRPSGIAYAIPVRHLQALLEAAR